MKPTASVFRLMRNSKPLETEEYVSNLTSYLDTIRSYETLILTDLNQVLQSLNFQVENCEKSSAPEISQPLSLVTNEDQSKAFEMGEHVAVFWLDQINEWHLGVVNSVEGNGALRILYLHSTDSTRKCWSNPDDEPHETPTEQFLYRNIKVQYMNSVRIKCELLDDNLVKS